MLKADSLSQLKQLKSEIKASRNLAKGTVKGSGNRFGFVTLESGKDVYLPPDEMNKVIPGDYVEVEIKKETGSKTVAVVERLIESPTKIFFGKYITKGKAHFVEADIAGMNRWIFVPPPKRNGAKTRDLVKCRLTQHPVRQGKAQAAVLEVLGSEKDQGIEWSYTIAKHGIETDWEPACHAEEEAASQKIQHELAEAPTDNRKDLTETPFVTIDGPGTLDLDDALFVEKHPEGWRLLVAIADPGSVIQQKSKIEEAVFQRATSVYLPGKQIPMLPKALASDICSLVAEKNRFAKVVDMVIRQDGSVADFSICKAVVRSHAKLSYEEASAAADSNDNGAITEEIKQSLLELRGVADQMHQWRQQNAIVSESRPEFYLELNDSQKIKAIKRKQKNPAHHWVEESMLAVNCCVASFLQAHKAPGVFVCHDGVRRDRLETLQKVISENVNAEEPLVLDSLEGFRNAYRLTREKDELAPFYRLITRQLERAYLKNAPAPHFGLGVPAYTTFTSPLRKANDFLVHQQVERILSGQAPAPIEASEVEAIEAQGQKARAAVNEVEQWLKCQYISEQQGAFKATVVRIFASGFQVRLLENGIEGFVSTREMEGKYSFNQSLLKLTGKEHAFELDKEVEVKVKHIDWTRKQIQFEIVSSGAEGSAA